MPATDSIYITFNDTTAGRITTQVTFPSSVPLAVRESIQVDLHNFAGDRNVLQKERDAFSRQRLTAPITSSNAHNTGLTTSAANDIKAISTDARLAVVQKEFENTALVQENARWKWRAESAERELVALRQQHSALQRQQLQLDSGNASLTAPRPSPWMMQPNTAAVGYNGAGYMFPSPYR